MSKVDLTIGRYRIVNEITHLQAVDCFLAINKFSMVAIPPGPVTKWGDSLPRTGEDNPS